MAPLRIVERESNGTNNFLANRMKRMASFISPRQERRMTDAVVDIFRSELSNQTFEMVRLGTDGVCWKLISLHFHSPWKLCFLRIWCRAAESLSKSRGKFTWKLAANGTEEYRAVIGNVKSKLIKFLFDVDDPTTVFVYLTEKLTRLKSDFIGFLSLRDVTLNESETILRSY